MVQIEAGQQCKVNVDYSEDQGLHYQLKEVEPKFCLDNGDISVCVQDPKVLEKDCNDTVKREADLLIEETSMNEEKVVSSFCWLHPEVKRNWKTVLSAALLFLSGTILIASGLYAITSTIYTTQGVNFFVAGLLCFIPGAYHVCYILLASKGYPGFEFDDLRIFS